LRAREIDLGFIETPVRPSDLARLRVGADRLTLVVGPGHPLARRRRPLGRKDLATLPLASREDGSGPREALSRALDTPVQPALELDSNAAVKVEVASGGYPAVRRELAAAARLPDRPRVGGEPAGLGVR